MRQVQESYSILERKSSNQQTGAALIMALLLVAIVAAIAATIMFSQQVDIERNILENSAAQARADQRYVYYWWQQRYQQLSTLRQKQQQVPVWPQQLPTLTLVNGDIISASVVPANAHFNLNNLAQPVSQYLTVFQNLLEAVEPQLGTDQAKQIALSTQAWLITSQTSDNDNNPYAKMSPPYQAAHQPMASASELRLVEGMTRDLYQKVRPFIIALPDTNMPIDVNAASENVLLGLLGLNPSAVQDVLQYRRANQGFLQDSAFLGLQSVQAYTGNTAQQGTDISKLITTKMPTYFLVHTVVKHDKMTFHYASILKYDAKQKSMTVLRQGQSL